MSEDLKKRGCWLSSAGMPHGVGSGSPLHFKLRLSDFVEDQPIVIIEGALKADALVALCPDLHIVATAGVSASHEALIELTRGRCVLIAFDQDYLTNADVCLRLAALIVDRRRCVRTLADMRIAVWDRGARKGLMMPRCRNCPLLQSVLTAGPANPARISNKKQEMNCLQELKIKYVIEDYYYVDGKRQWLDRLSDGQYDYYVRNDFPLFI